MAGPSTTTLDHHHSTYEVAETKEGVAKGVVPADTVEIHHLHDQRDTGQVPVGRDNKTEQLWG